MAIPTLYCQSNVDDTQYIIFNEKLKFRTRMEKYDLIVGRKIDKPKY